MTKVSYTPVLKKKNTKDTSGIINVRVTQDRKSIYHSTKISLHQRFWNIKGKDIQGKLRDQKGFDTTERESIINVVNELLNDLKKVNEKTGDIKFTKHNEKKSFLFHLEEFIAFLESRNQIGTSKRYRTSLYHLRKFLAKSNKTDLLFIDLTSSFIQSFETYLIQAGNKTNTTKNYINCIKRIYSRCVGMGIFTSSLDPFIYFKNRRADITKDYLEKKHLEMMMSCEIEKTNPLYHTRNYFLFQVFGQGLRISDLLTLRFDKIREGNITFFQYKTRKENTIYLTPMSMWILKDYLNTDEVAKIVNRKYRWDGTDYLTIDEIKTQYGIIRKKYLEAHGKEQVEIMKEVERWNRIFEKANDAIFKQLAILLLDYSKSHKPDLIFPICDPKIFQGIDFNENTMLSKKQYNHLQSKTTVYNRDLKKLQKLCDISMTLTSHLARHTYTNLMLSVVDGDVYEISKSLGHQGLKTTERYVATIRKKVEDRNKDLGTQFSFLTG